MRTYVAGTDGVPASNAISDFLEPRVADDDRIEAIHVLIRDTAEKRQAGQDALEVFEEQFAEGPSVMTHQFNRGKSPATELVEHADEVDADQIVSGLRRHSRTERIVFGSVSNVLVKRTTRPVTLLPLQGYEPTDEGPTRDLKFMY